MTILVSARFNWCIVAWAVAFFVAGVAFSHRVEPGVHVKAVSVAKDTPVLQFLPTTSGPHPVALLAHGATASKETLFRFGEALAKAGFVCFAIDFPRHGASPRSFSVNEIVRTAEEVARALGSVDVFIGHSMGAGAGAAAVRNGGLSPRLFMAVGANPNLGTNGPPLLLLAGRFEEFVRPARLKARTDARLVLSPWSDHLLEPYDPYLVNAAVQAACAAVGKTPPSAPTTWRWRFAGLVLGMLSALALMFCLPELSPRLARARGLLVPLIIIATVVLTTGTWVGSALQWRRVPVQVAVMIVTWLALAGVAKLRIPRWSLPVVGALFTLGCITATAYVTAHSKDGEVIFRFWFLWIRVGIMTVFLLAGTVLGWFVARRGSRLDGDMAMAIFVGYAIGQWIPRTF